MISEPLRLLVAESEPAPARRRRRASVGTSAGETFEALLARLAPHAETVRVQPVDGGRDLPDGGLAGFDAVLLTGSPIRVHQETPESRRAIAFMRAVFDAGLPAFGSCAGLQLAAVAAGGSVRPMGERREAGFARRIVATADGAAHPLLAGRPPAFDAPAIHTDEVDRLPPHGALLLASNAVTRVQAAEIRHGAGVFWGVQYHPEIDLFEVAGALERQADDLVEHGLAPSPDAICSHAALIRALHDDPARADLKWRLGLDDQVADGDLRPREIANFLRHLVLPARSGRARGAPVALAG